MRTALSNTEKQLAEATSNTNPTLVAEKVKALAPLQTARIGVLRQKYDEVRALARRGEQIVDEIVESYSKKLDEFVDTLDKLLEQLRNDKGKISDQMLNRAVLRLPILMYNLHDMLERSAIEHDVSKAANKAVYADAYLKATGTIPDKEAQAELVAADEAVIVDLSKHVYKRLQGKLDHANSLFDGIRKVMTSRDSERNTFGKERT